MTGNARLARVSRRPPVFLRRAALFCAGLVCALVAPAAGAEFISQGRFENPVTRYGHFALGRPHEYARIFAITDAGRSLSLELPDNEVFEDIAPRLVRLAPDEAPQLLTIVSSREAGARLALVALHDGRLHINAQSAAIGTPMRWLNPVGVADLDGDGRAEIAAVITPHIGGTLKVYRREGAALVEIAALGGFSNHIYGTPELALSLTLALTPGGKTRLLVPDTARRNLRVIALELGKLVETARCPLRAPLTTAIAPAPPFGVSIGAGELRQLIKPGECPPPR